MTKIALLGGRIIDPAHRMDENANLYIADGKIHAIASSLADFEADISIDASGMVVCPGLVDLSANILESKGGLKAFPDYLKKAPAAGITSVGSQACLSNRVLEASEIEGLARLSQASSCAKAYFIGPLTQNLEGKRLAELMLLKQAGCVGFSNDLRPMTNSLIKKRCYDYAAMLGLKIFVAPEDPFLSEHGVMHEGQVSTRLGLSGIPVLAETLALAQELILIEDTGVSAHFGRLSSGHSVELLRSAHDKGLIVTSDTAIHQLYLTEVDVHLDSGLCHVRPPFRNISDKNGLRAGIANYLITAITSDHKTLPLLVKEVPFQDSEPGIASWPVLLPLVLRLATEEQIPLTTALACITHQPAKILGIDAGHLKLGARADVTIFDPKEHWTFDKNDLDNFGHNTPFANWQLQGRVKCTIIDGEIAYRNKTTPSP